MGSAAKLKSLECDVGVQGGLQLAVRAPIDDIPGSDDHDFDLDAAREEHFDEMMLGLSSEEYLALYGESAPPMPPRAVSEECREGADRTAGGGPGDRLGGPVRRSQPLPGASAAVSGRAMAQAVRPGRVR